ncbi:MAG: hypothetical protein WCO12_01020 [bacterium]
MKILKPTPANQELLGLEFDRWPINRDRNLIEMMKIRAQISEEYALPFNQINLPSKLSFGPIALESDEIQINAGVAHEKLLEVAAKGEIMPLCLWSVDAIFSHQTKNGSGPNLPERPSPGKKLIILTHGTFKESAQGTYCYIYLKETEHGFEICTMTTHQTFLLYPKPHYDLVTLCIPTASCSMSS